MHTFSVVEDLNVFIDIPLDFFYCSIVLQIDTLFLCRGKETLRTQNLHNALKRHKISSEQGESDRKTVCSLEGQSRRKKERGLLRATKKRALFQALFGVLY